MAKIEIEYDESALRELVLKDLQRTMPNVDFADSDIKIEVKSKQNFRSEWEPASFRATVKHTQ